MNNPSPPCVVVITAPSGAGKTTLARRLMQARGEMRFSVSATTRRPREGEHDGSDYHFMTDETFDKAIEEGRFLEWEEVYPGCRYGTLRSEVDSSSASSPVLLDIDVQGAVSVKRHYGDRALTLFIKPPSLEELERRLTRRETESEESLRHRLDTARKELTWESRFDHVIVNDDLETASTRLNELVTTFLSSCRSF